MSEKNKICNATSEKTPNTSVIKTKKTVLTVKGTSSSTSTSRLQCNSASKSKKSVICGLCTDTCKNICNKICGNECNIKKVKKKEKIDKKAFKKSSLVEVKPKKKAMCTDNCTDACKTICNKVCHSICKGVSKTKTPSNPEKDVSQKTAAVDVDQEVDKTRKLDDVNAKKSDKAIKLGINTCSNMFLDNKDASGDTCANITDEKIQSCYKCNNKDKKSIKKDENIKSNICEHKTSDNKPKENKHTEDKSNQKKDTADNKCKCTDKKRSTNITVNNNKSTVWEDLKAQKSENSARDTSRVVGKLAKHNEEKSYDKCCAYNKVCNNTAITHYPNPRENLTNNIIKNTIDDNVLYKYNKETKKLLVNMNKLSPSNKDHVIRELIVNASNACDRYSFACHNLKSCKVNEKHEFRITIHTYDKYIVIEDNGIGMTKAEFVKCLGRITTSIATKFKKNIQEESHEHSNSAYGYGLYGAFMIAEHIKVVTKNQCDKTYEWESKSFDEFSIIESEVEIEHGTKIILMLKKEEIKYGKKETIEELIKKYSPFISYPLYVTDKKDDTKQETEDDENSEKAITINNIKPEKPVLVGNKKPIWSEDPSKISQGDYLDFYKTLTGDCNSFLTLIHKTISDEDFQITLLLFMPKLPLVKMFDIEKTSKIKLYVGKTFVTHNLRAALPEWMDFMVGVISSKEEVKKLNQEDFRYSKTMRLIKSRLCKEILNYIYDFENNRDVLDLFLQAYGVNLKMAIRDTKGSYQDRLASMLRFHTTNTIGTDKKIGFDDYILRNKNSKEIYIITGFSKHDVYNISFLKLYHNEEVVFMYEPVDEIMLQGLFEYQNCKIVRITAECTTERGKIDEEIKTGFEDFVKDYALLLKCYVEKVNLRDIGSSPCLVATQQDACSPTYEKIMTALPSCENITRESIGKKKNVLEINPKNPIVQNIKQLYDDNNDSWKDYALLLYQTSMVECGFKIDNNVLYSSKVFAVMNGNLTKGNKINDEVKNLLLKSKKKIDDKNE